MAQKIRVVIKGLGAVGKQFVEEAIGRGAEIVGGVDAWEELHGKDLGTHAGIAPLGLPIEADLAPVLERTRPDVLVLANASTVAEQAEDMRLAAACGANIISSAENAFYWQRIEPELGAQLDAELREAGVSALGTGIQDVFWSGLPAVLSAGCHRVERIDGRSLGIMDPYGPVVMEEARIGWTLEQFEASRNDDAPQHLDPGAVALFALADRLGLTVINENVRVDPVVAEKPAFAQGLGREVPAGQLIGNAAILELETAQGIVLTSTFTARLSLFEGETESAEWEITGHPNLRLKVDDFHGDVTTTSAMVNRLPDVIAAEPGFVTVADLPLPQFRAEL